MKKLLILAYDFPPYVSVGGLRPYAWYRYFKEFGVDPIVITRQWKDKHGNALDYIEAGISKDTIIEETDYGTIIRAPYFPSLSNRILLKYGENKFRLLRRAMTAIDEIRQFIVPSGPKSTLYFAAKDYLKENKVDAIIATGDPFILFYFASKLSKEFRTPWIADYRDPWSVSKLRQINWFYHVWLKMIEKRIVSSSKVIMTVSDFLKESIQTLFSDKTYYIFPNGYDPENINKLINTSQKTQILTISFVGTIYPWHPWKSFISAFSEFIESDKNIEMKLHFYGINITEDIESFIHTLPDKTKFSIHIFPKMSNQSLLGRLSSENVMLLFNDYTIMGTKIFDYIGVKRQIILCYRNDKEALALKKQCFTIEKMDETGKQLQTELIQEIQAGIIVENKDELRTVLRDLYLEFQHKSKIECHTHGIEIYSRKNQVQKMAALIESMF